jgi:hypothetical protein
LHNNHPKPEKHRVRNWWQLGWKQWSLLSP